MTARLVPAGIDQLEGRDWVLLAPPGGEPVRRVLEESRVYGDKVVVKFEGVDDAAAAEGLVGQDILIPCNGLVDLPEGSYYIFELVGLTVRTRAGRTLGKVRDVVSTGGTPLFAVVPEDETAEGGEILLPAAASICTSIDRERGVITVDPPEGLLELYGL